MIGRNMLIAEKSQSQRQSLMAIQLAIEGEGDDEEVDNFQADFLHPVNM